MLNLRSFFTSKTSDNSDPTLTSACMLWWKDCCHRSEGFHSLGKGQPVHLSSHAPTTSLYAASAQVVCPRGMHHHSLPAQPECQSCLQPCHRFLKSTDQLLFTRVCVKFENGDKRQTYSPLLLTKLTLCALLTHYRKIAFARWRSCFLAIVYT